LFISEFSFKGAVDDSVDNETFIICQEPVVNLLNAFDLPLPDGRLIKPQCGFSASSGENTQAKSPDRGQG